VILSSFRVKPKTILKSHGFKVVIDSRALFPSVNRLRIEGLRGEQVASIIQRVEAVVMRDIV